MRIYVAYSCGSCGNDVYQLAFVLDEHRGVPVVPADVGTESRFECDSCGTVNWTGDLEVRTDD